MCPCHLHLAPPLHQSAHHPVFTFYRILTLLPSFLPLSTFQLIHMPPMRLHSTWLLLFKPYFSLQLSLLPHSPFLLPPTCNSLPTLTIHLASPSFYTALTPASTFYPTSTIHRTSSSLHSPHSPPCLYCLPYLASLYPALVQQRSMPGVISAG